MHVILLFYRMYVCSLDIFLFYSDYFTLQHIGGEYFTHQHSVESDLRSGKFFQTIFNKR